VLTPVNLTITGQGVAQYLLGLVRSRWALLLAGAGLGALTGGAYGLLAAPVYRSEAVLAATATEVGPGALASVVSKLGPIASLAGLGAPSSTTSQEAIAVLTSYGFTADFIRAHDLLPVLFPGEWHDGSRDRPKDGEGRWPTVADGVKVFDEKVRKVVVDDAAEIVRLRIEWTDRVLAAQWANDLVATINSVMRERARTEATRNIEYLAAEIERTDSVALQQALYQILEQQAKRKMLAAAQRNFAFRVLDAAQVREAGDFERPKRMLVVVVAATSGLFLAAVIALLMEVVREGRRPSAT